MREFNIDNKKTASIVNLNVKHPNEDYDNDYFPTRRGEFYSFSEIPKSLEDAILHFLISIFIRKYRNQSSFNTMLVHTSHLTENVTIS